MMRKYLKESLHWLHLGVFKPVTLQAEERGVSTKQQILIYLRVLPVQLVVVLTVMVLAGILCELAGIRFNWIGAILASAIYAPVFGLIAGLGYALGPGLVVGLVFGLGGGLGFGLVFGLGGGLVFGLVFGLSVALRGALRGGLVFPLFVGLVFGLVSALVSGLASGLVGGLTDAVRFALAYVASFSFVYLRPFYLVPYAIQRWRSRKSANPFQFLRNSPVYWDEAIPMPLPFLSDWLVRLAYLDRERGMTEIANVARLPYQRRAAQRALVSIVVEDLRKADSLNTIALAPEILATLPSGAQYSPQGLDDATRHIRKVAELASDYLTRVTPVGQTHVLNELFSALKIFFNAMVLIKPPAGPAFQTAAMRWLEIVKAEEVRVRERTAFEPIPNSFVVGNPLMLRDNNLFKGRKDIVFAIEDNIINPAQRPALLLYGRRRIGKTSTLLNLPRLLSSQFVPVFIDCQDAKWREGDATFCYHLAASIHGALNQRLLVETASKPQLEQFERYAFTRLGEYLDQIEALSRLAQKQILLTFDEYEKLEDGISNSRVTTEVLNQLRTIVQHRERIVVLFSGGHRFEEMVTINWSDYLINVKTLELSFLASEDARELITEPVPLLQYEPGVIDQIIELTHCQPYLLQAVASELVNYLNSKHRVLATSADLDVAVEKVLVTVQSYFFYTWTGDCSEGERDVLRLIAAGDTNTHTLDEHQSDIQSLCHKEILEGQARSYRFSIELFRRWVLKNQPAQAFPPGDLQEPHELEYADLQTTHS